MRVDLVELLRTREIIHPSRIVMLESKCSSDVRIEVSGYSWWRENPEPGNDERITFHIEGITEGGLGSDMLQADTFDADLASFDVRPLSDYEWAKGAHCDVYCNGPVSNPFDVYARLHDFLIGVDCPYAPGHYLNLGNSGSFDEFEAIASSASFLLCRGPEAVCQAICTVLRERGASFNIVRGGDRTSGLIFVRLKGSYLICRSAYAVFDNS